MAHDFYIQYAYNMILLVLFVLFQTLFQALLMHDVDMMDDDKYVIGLMVCYAKINTCTFLHFTYVATGFSTDLATIVSRDGKSSLGLSIIILLSSSSIISRVSVNSAWNKCQKQYNTSDNSEMTSYTHCVLNIMQSIHRSRITLVQSLI